MEKYLAEIFKLADSLNKKQEKVYAQITYYADDTKVLEIAIRSKIDSNFIERCQVQLKYAPLKKLKMVAELFNSYVGSDIADE